MPLHHVRSVVVALAWLVIALGCTSAPERVCQPGATQRCVCSAGEGAQSCNTEGTGWLACSCSAIDAGLDAGGGGETDAAMPADTGATGDVGADADLPACADGAMLTTVHDVANGAIGEAVPVAIAGAVAMSPPFLLSRSATTGSCLWAAFVSAPGLTETGPGTGVLVTSYGDVASIPPGGSSPRCPIPGMAPSGSAIPDDLAPGDVVDVVGETRTLALPSCGSIPDPATTGQRVVAEACAVVRRGRAPVPMAHVVTAGELGQLATQSDDTFHRSWAGVLVRAVGVTASAPAAPATCAVGTTVVDQFGTITLDGSGARVGVRVYYDGLLGSSNPCRAAPRYCGSATQSFSAIEGFVALDFCTWSLWPADRCADYTPASTDCSGACLL